jgi:rSAM/selenodomain-associated transferase 2
MSVKLSVILPTLNESRVIEQTLQKIQSFGPHEIIVGDGGSWDETNVIAEKMGAKTVQASKGRASQMNAAAQVATGEVFWFFHADSEVEPIGYQRMIENMSSNNIVGGAFSLDIASSKRSLKMISIVATLRSKYFGVVYGDQGIFVRKEVFRRMGGYKNLPICEDMDFFQRLRKEGEIKILDEKALTSARRWLSEGIVFTTLRNWLIASLFILGFPPKILSRWYLAIR